jgi:hypothetical protein
MSHSTYLAGKILRGYGHMLSDEQTKLIEENTDAKELAQYILHQGPPYNIRQVQMLVRAIGDMDTDHNFEKDGHAWRDDVLDNYAKYIQNYMYTYNDEALKVDPSIDTEQEHIGPMAQDIEKVNPAAVQEDPGTGYKTVDTGRLALMNAGAIAELARQVKELQSG